MLSVQILDQVTTAELEAEIVALKQTLVECGQEIARLQQTIAACCPWWERRWHRPH
jgi:hypothetical protein